MSLEFFTPKEIAQMFKVDTKTVYRWIKSGKLKAVILSRGTLRITKEEIDRLLKTQTN